MKTIGVISDTHDNLDAIKRAKAFFLSKNVDLLIHAGDFVAPFAVKRLVSDLSIEWKGVFGNNDGEKEGLSQASSGAIVAAPLIFPLEGKTIYVTHVLREDDPRLPSVDVVIYGHSHKPDIRVNTVGGKQVLFINPGEAGGWVTGRSTVALLTVPSLQAEIFGI